jgi:hypothetical protein
MSETEKASGLQLLRVPFSENQISLLPKPYKKDSAKGNCKECGGFHGLPAMHLKYVGHASLTDRLLDVDPTWSWEPLALDDSGLPLFDKTGGLWIKLTILGITRLGYGNATLNSYADIGSREKEVIGDALRNSAMRFGAALDLWHKGDLHGDDEEKESIKESSPKVNTDAILTKLREASIKGKNALKTAVSAMPPGEPYDSIWKENKQALMEVAKKADAPAMTNEVATNAIKAMSDDVPF